MNVLKTDIRTWPIRDVKELEQRIGKKSRELFRQGEQPTADDLVIFYEIARRQDDPKFTTDAAEATTFGQIVAEINEAMAAALPLTQAEIQNSTDGSRHSPISTGTRRTK
jgi:hypothetical protein